MGCPPPAPPISTCGPAKAPGRSGRRGDSWTLTYCAGWTHERVPDLRNGSVDGRIDMGYEQLVHNHPPRAANRPPIHTQGSAVATSRIGYHFGPNSGPWFHVAASPAVAATMPMIPSTRT